MKLSVGTPVMMRSPYRWKQQFGPDAGDPVELGDKGVIIKINYLGEHLLVQFLKNLSRPLWVHRSEISPL